MTLLLKQQKAAYARIESVKKCMLTVLNLYTGDAVVPDRSITPEVRRIVWMCCAEQRVEATLAVRVIPARLCVDGQFTHQHIDAWLITRSVTDQQNLNVTK